MVGVPFFFRCVCGPSSLTVCPTFNFLKIGIITGPAAALITKEIRTARTMLIFVITHTSSFICSFEVYVFRGELSTTFSLLFRQCRCKIKIHMQVWFIGRTSASQAEEGGSTPLTCLSKNFLNIFRAKGKFSHRNFPFILYQLSGIFRSIPIYGRIFSKIFFTTGAQTVPP